MQSPGIKINHQCPQCGAPAILEETDHLFSCQYCRVKSILISRDFFRYIIPCKAAADKDLLYFPYWRLKGCMFSSTPGGVRHRIVDVSSKASACDHFPLSLGLRTQTLNLNYLSSDTQGSFLKSDISFKNVLSSTARRFSTQLPGPLFLNSFIGDTISKIYAPFYLQGGKVFDAVLNRSVQAFDSDAFHREDHPMTESGWKIRFVPAICPACGWDIQGRRDSLAFSCTNCNSMWLQSRDRFLSLEFATVPAGEKNVIYLPFYRTGADITGLELNSFADLIRLGNLPRVANENCRKRQFYFWTPAFKIRPGELLGFSSRLTLIQPEEQWNRELPQGESHPVTLSASEAAGLLKVVLADFLRPKSLLEGLADIRISPQQPLVVYLPFHLRGRELYQHQFRLRLNRNVLDYAGFL